MPELGSKFCQAQVAASLRRMWPPASAVPGLARHALGFEGSPPPPVRVSVQRSTALQPDFR